MKLSEAMEQKPESKSPKGKPSKQDKEDHGELRSIRVEPAENGYTVSCDYEPKKSAGKGEPMPYSPPENYVFESALAASDYVSECLKDHEGYEGKEK